MIRLANRLGFLLLCFSAPVQAEPLPDLQELLNQPLHQVPRDTEVSAASRATESSSASMAITHVVTDEDILRYNLRSMADILELFVGVTTRDDGSFVYIGARGLGRPADFNSRILFLLNGTRINENMLGAGLLGNEFFVDVELIERVEFSPGAAAALYGNNAQLGVVNIVTKSTSSLRGLEASVQLTDDREKSTRLSFGHRSAKGEDTWLSVSHTRRDSIDFAFADVLEQALQWQSLNHERSTRIMASHQRGGLQIQAAGAWRERTYPDFPFSVNEDAVPATDENEVLLLALSYDRRLDDNTDLYLHASTHANDFNRSIPSSLDSSQLVFFDNLNSGRWSNLDSRLIYHGWRDHKVLVGVDLQKDHRQIFDSRLKGEDPLQRVTSDDFRYGLYLQDLWQISDNMALQWALRFDNSEQSAARWSPSISFSYTLSDRSRLLFRHSRAFRAANRLERVNNELFDVPELSSESIYHSEVSLKQRWSDSFSSFTTLYYADIDRLITEYVDFPVFYNSPPVKSYGIEGGIDKRWQMGATLEASLALQRSADDEFGRLVNSPEIVGKLRYSQPLWSPELTFSWQLRGVSERLTSFGRQPGYLSHNVSLTWKPQRNLDVALGLRNVTNKKIEEITDGSGIPYLQQRQRAHLSLRWRWQ